MTGQFNEAELAQWCSRHLGVTPVETLWRAGHLSSVVAFRLEDERMVVLKVRPQANRLMACFAIQLYLWENGFPCPRPLAGPLPLGPNLVTAEELVPPGDRLEGGIEVAPRFAAALASLVRLATSAQLPGLLEPAPPWMGWAHPEPGLWPPPDDIDADLNASSDPQVDDVARRVVSVLQDCQIPRVVGHVDWHAGNLEWLNGRLHVVHDWDSLAQLPEAAIAGGASVLFTHSSRAAASLSESQAFFNAYESARGRPWTTEESRVFWAAGLWNLAFDAKKQTLDGQGEALQRLEKEAEDRLRLAGA